MFWSTNEEASATENELSPRIENLRNAVLNARPGVCAERAVIWTRYFKDPANRGKPRAVKIAEALSRVLAEKSIAIHPEELIVGNYSSRRVGGSLFPELHGLVVKSDLFAFRTRKTNPLEISVRDQAALAAIAPFWATRFLGAKAYRSKAQTARLLVNQLLGREYFINESGGISHVAPDFEKLLRLGTEGIAKKAAAGKKTVARGTPEHAFYQGVETICEGLARFGERYAALARTLAKTESDPRRAAELKKIAEVCGRVPRKPARSFHEALQALFFTQIALNLESLDNSMCPGRADQYLHPYLKKDLESGALTRAQARDLVFAFSIKFSEIIPVFSKLITRVHGGMFNGQIINVGGVGRDGGDAANDLTYLFLEAMDALRMRQPNYTARVHKNAPEKYLKAVYGILAKGANSPALYNDEVIVPTMQSNGYALADARDYTPVGCVEPVCQGKSFSSTDAALINVPLALELALNQGRRFGSRLRLGVKTKRVRDMNSLDHLKKAFAIQLEGLMDRCIADLQAIEVANAEHHPTPLTSSLLSGCLENGLCSTAGGARYNYSGIQCVGATDVGDSFAAIQKIVFTERRMTLPTMVRHLKANLADEGVRRMLSDAPKFGNDDEAADRETKHVIETFARLLKGRRNTRGGDYEMGLYSVTTHEHFGEVTGALPNGRRKGEPYAAGMAPTNGADRKGPTALLNSMNRLDFSLAGNGINFNVKFDARTLSGTGGSAALNALMKTYFRRGGMQAQVNVLDPAILVAARDNPEAYPHLLVRVSGYSAYFNDLTPEIKDEIIKRTCLSA